MLSLSPQVDLSKIVGDTITVGMDLPGGGTRYFHGYVTRVALVGTYGGHARYRATLHPWLHLLSGRVNSRIFQNKSVPDIAKALFGEHGFSDFELHLSGSYAPREYVVQYRESDFNFVSRLFEHSGIYYYFKHEKNRHVLVLGDSLGAHETVEHYAEVPFHPEGGLTPTAPECINNWEVAQQWRSGSYVADDFDFTKPKVDLTAKLKSAFHKKKGDLEVYDYPGGFPDRATGQDYVRARLEALQSDTETGHGSGDVRGLFAGSLFKLTHFPIESQNKEYLIVSTAYDIANNPFNTGPGAAGGPASTGSFHWSFNGIDSQVPFRPMLATARARVEGVQTAMVVGPAGEEIHSDKYGRVKVQFHWDREGKNDEKSSCWVRVAQLWAGNTWGGIHIPRIGQEVIVDFLEGDPDRPIITGRVYNGESMPPYELPANQTQSGIKSRSSKGGTAANFNEFRFEDKKGSEEVYIHAEKDLNSIVENDETRGVGHDRTTDIGNDETITVGHDRTEKVKNDEDITIVGNRTESVSKNESVTVGQNRTLTVALNDVNTVGVSHELTVGASDTTSIGGSQSLSVGASRSVDIGGNQSTRITGARTLDVTKDDTETVTGKRTVKITKEDILEIGKKLSINVKDEISITTGDATISMKKNGDITIKGKNITIDGSGKINVKASGDVIIKGSKIAQN
jgi:type VI secretion system secreted protein VgrG